MIAVTVGLLASVQALHESLGRTFDPTDVRAIRNLEDASAFIRGYTQQEITTVTDDEVALDGSGRFAILLPQIPVTTLTSITIADVELDVTAYRVDRSGIVWRLDGLRWPLGHGNIGAKYDHGHDEVPPDLVGVCVNIASDLDAKEQRQLAGGGVSSLTLGPFSVGYQSPTQAQILATLAWTDRRILDNYRVPQ
ncbi:MAG: hypothetical protein M3P43_13250 [Actinomycetota bacterium]|nr:hypothetical protein [Actinomycetota bacterium]